MNQDFRPYWLIGLLVLSGVSLWYLFWLQGRGIDMVPEAGFEWGAQGSVLGYAGQVMERSLEAAYPTIMLFLFAVMAIYAAVQALALVMDARRLRQVSGGQPCFPMPRWLASVVGPLIARGASRLSEACEWGPARWSRYAAQAQGALLSPLELAVQVFPLLGFVGTIAGIASALRFLPIEDNPEASVSSLTLSLYTAFDTTFIGLVASLILLLASYGMGRAWTTLHGLADSLSDPGEHGAGVRPQMRMPDATR